MNSIFSYTLSELTEQVELLGMKPFVAKQLMEWVYKKNVDDINLMTSISTKNRLLLSQHLSVSLFPSVETVTSSDGTAIKLLCQLSDNKIVECVVLNEQKYLTLCVSSQVGCPVDCKFCLTGIGGFQRNLEASEIVMQIMTAYNMGYKVKNLVFMGMGEPLLNYDHVFKAIDILSSEWGASIGKRHMTVSTSGYIASITRLIQDERYINLAFSVGAADPKKRASIMPVEKRNPILEVARLLKSYLSSHNRKLTLEYTLLKGVNDTSHDIRLLVNLSKYLNAKINLINLNPHEKIPFSPVSSKWLNTIKQTIAKERVPVTVRFKKGQDIVAACGQLGESNL